MSQDNSFHVSCDKTTKLAQRNRLNVVDDKIAIELNGETIKSVAKRFAKLVQWYRPHFPRKNADDRQEFKNQSQSGANFQPPADLEEKKIKRLEEIQALEKEIKAQGIVFEIKDYVDGNPVILVTQGSTIPLNDEGLHTDTPHKNSPKPEESTTGGSGDLLKIEKVNGSSGIGIIGCLRRIDNQFLDQIKELFNNKDDIDVFNARRLDELAGHAFAYVMKNTAPSMILPPEVVDENPVRIIPGDFSTLGTTEELKREFQSSFSWLLAQRRDDKPKRYENYYPEIYYDAEKLPEIKEKLTPELAPYHKTAWFLHEIGHILLHWDNFITKMMKKGERLSVKSLPDGKKKEREAWEGAKQLFQVLYECNTINGLTEEIHKTVVEHIFNPYRDADIEKAFGIDDTKDPPNSGKSP